MDIGVKGHRELVVTEELTARAAGSGELEVFATPMLVALAEETAWRSVAPQLEDGQGTVGTRLEIEHIAATPVGMRVWCDTELVEADGRRLSFTVIAFDEAGQIARGAHERFIVDGERFQAKANGKLA